MKKSLIKEFIDLIVEDEINEFSGAGSGAIVGYSLPLGADPDQYGRQLNVPKKKKPKKQSRKR